jgi:hypothetical protein
MIPFNLITATICTLLALTLQAGASGGAERNSPQLVDPKPAIPDLFSFECNPTTVSAYGSTTCTVSLNAAVPGSPNKDGPVVIVSLTWPSGSREIHIAPGFARASVPIPLNNDSPDRVQVAIQAQYKNVTKTVMVTMQPAILKGLNIMPTEVWGGAFNSSPPQGTVKLAAPAPQGGLPITLTADSTVAIFPKHVTVPGGQTEVTFPIQADAVASNTAVTITASVDWQGDTDQTSAQILVHHPDLRSIDLINDGGRLNDVPLGGDPVTLGVRLYSPAAPGTFVDVSYTGNGQVTGSSRVEIPVAQVEGKGTFTVFPCATAQCNVVVTASYAGESVQRTITYKNPAQASSSSSVGSTVSPAEKPGVPCCTMIPNPALKGQMGRLVLTFPKEVEYRLSRVEIVPVAGGPARKYQGSTSVDLVPGQYNVAVSNSRVAQVTITSGSETHLLVGGLRIQAGAKMRVEVWDAGRTRMLEFNYGQAVIGLPVGRYAVKIGKGAGNFTDIAIEDGKVSEFPMAVSQAAAGSSGSSEMAATGVTCGSSAKKGSYLAPDAKIRGVCSPASENSNHEPDPVPVGVPVRHAIRLAGGTGPITTRRLVSTNDGRQMVQQAAQRLGGFQMHLALLAGHKYMVNSCLGIKASAGTFDLVVPPPTITFGATSATISFGVSHIALDAFSVRLRPDPTDVIQPCHFSGRIGIGGSADDVMFSMTVDPLYDLKTCQITALNVTNAGWRIGSFHLAPLPSEVTGVAKEMVVDAMDYYSGLGLQDRFLQNLSDQLSPNELLVSTACKELH